MKLHQLVVLSLPYKKLSCLHHLDLKIRYGGGQKAMDKVSSIYGWWVKVAFTHGCKFHIWFQYKQAQWVWEQVCLPFLMQSTIIFYRCNYHCWHHLLVSLEYSLLLIKRKRPHFMLSLPNFSSMKQIIGRRWQFCGDQKPSHGRSQQDKPQVIKSP